MMSNNPNEPNASTPARINTALQRPFLFLHESAHYLTARALGMTATRYSSHTTFHPDDGDNAAILTVLLAPCAVGLLLLLATAALLLVAPQWWIIPVHTGLLGLWFVASSASDLHTIYVFLRRGSWRVVEHPEQLETIGEWINHRLQGRAEHQRAAQSHRRRRRPRSGSHH